MNKPTGAGAPVGCGRHWDVMAAAGPEGRRDLQTRAQRFCATAIGMRGTGKPLLLSTSTITRLVSK